MDGPARQGVRSPAAVAAASCKECGQMASDKRVHVTLECTECKRRNYITNKSKVNDRERIEMKKYCKWDRRHTLHKETR
jgi:large subunit ribosomal protein L33